MTRSYVALDVETTGLQPGVDRITEVGAVRFLDDGTILETFETLIDPEREIPTFISGLTGISEDAVREAPRLVDVADRLTRFIGDSVVVGQNIGFDLAFLRHGGVQLNTAAVDTAELSRMLLPGRHARGLMDLATVLEVEAEPHHRAAADARTAAAVFLALRRKAEAIPEELRLQVARLAAFQDITLAETIAGDGWRDVAPISRAPSLRTAPVYTALEKVEPRLPVQPGDTTKALAAGPEVIDGFEERAEQVEMAEAIGAALTAGGHYVVEAGTGVGKSMAYLLPAAIHALRTGERVVVSTNTIALQEQLLQKDLPAVRQLLVKSGFIGDVGDLRVALLKGRANYLCLRRWVANAAAGLGDPDFVRLAANVLLWLPETETGDRSELRLSPSDFVTWQRLSAQDTDCLQRHDRFVREGQCFLQRSRKAAESAHILIVNHALLLADLAAGGSAVPAYDHLIVDEAHNIEEVATRTFGATITRRRIAEALDGVYRRANRDQKEGGVATLLTSFPPGALHEAGLKLQTAVAAAHEQGQEFFATLLPLTAREGEDERARVTKGTRTSEAWEQAEERWIAFNTALHEVAKVGGEAAALLTSTSPVEDPDVLAGEIQAALRRVEDLRGKADGLMAQDDGSVVTWISRESDGTGSLNSAPLDAGPELWESLFERKRTVVATSATLSAGGSMAFSARRMGLQDAQTLQLGSPFDYQRSTLLAAVDGMPEPNVPGYDDALANTLVELVTASRGRALALFTSHSAMRRVAGLARGPLAARGISVLVQGIDGHPRQLIGNLMDSPATLLCGTQSFWEGVDIRGDALSLLVIARLPFAVPTDPVHRARSEQYDDPFGQYSLPTAILRFRQGFGRLIRSKEDRGVVVVLDGRIRSKRYGGDFVSSLPPVTKVAGSSLDVADRIREWLL